MLPERQVVPHIELHVKGYEEPHVYSSRDVDRERGQEIAADIITAPQADLPYENPVDQEHNDQHLESDAEATISPPNPDNPPVPDETDDYDISQGYLSRLSTREKEVAALLELGRNHQEIATQLDITEGTAKNHIFRVNQKKKQHIIETGGTPPTPPTAADNLRDILAENTDLSLLTPREKEIVFLLQQGGTTKSIADALQLEQSYISGCITRITGKQTATLNETESRIHELMCAGKTNAEIAEELHLSVGAVSGTAPKILRKLGVEDRTDLWTAEAIENLSPKYITVALDRTANPEVGSLLPTQRFLTPREYEVAQLMLENTYTNQELAQHLGVEVWTIMNHLHAIYTKLGLRSREELQPETVEVFKPHSLIEQRDLTLEERAARLPDLSYQAIVPLEPQKILTRAEFEIFKALAQHEDSFQEATESVRNLSFGDRLKREIEMAEKKLQLRSNEEIAELFNLETGTVKNHMSALLAKLNLNTREDAVQLYHFYRQEGIL